MNLLDFEIQRSKVKDTKRPNTVKKTRGILKVMHQTRVKNCPVHMLGGFSDSAEYPEL